MMNSNLEQNFTQALKLITSSKNILLTTHENTDGDDFGTVSALALYLQKIGSQPVFCIKGGVPKQLSYLATGSWKHDTEGVGQYDLLIISGCSNKKRVGIEWIEKLDIPVINFDHHPDNTLYGTINVVDAAKSSVAELMYDFLKFAGAYISPAMATCLLTGIFTDTGSFMHSSTQSSTYKSAGELLKLGADITKVARNNYKNKAGEALKAWGSIIQDATLNPDNKLIFSIVKSEHLATLPNSVFEGLVETLNKAEEALFSMLLKEDGDFIKGSLRSDPHKNVDVNKIAGTLGGGGHKWASGFKLKGKLKFGENQIEVEKN